MGIDEVMSVTTVEKTETINLSELGKKFIGGAMWMSAAQIGSYGLTFGANILLARLLAPDVFGIFALASSILSIFYILGSWSFSVAVIQTEEMDQAFFDTAFALSLGLGGVLFGLVVLASFPLRAFYSIQVIRILLILAALQVLTLLSGCYSATLKRDLEYKNVSLIEAGTRVIDLIVAIAMAWGGCGVWSLVGKRAVFVVGSFIGMRLISSWRFKGQFNTDAARRLFSFGSQMFAASGLESFLSNIQGFLIGTMLGTTALGYFDRALKLSQLGHTVAGPAVNQVSLAAYSRLQKSESKLSQAFEAINYFLIRIFVMVGIIFLLLGEDITVLLYGEKWRTAGQVVPFLAVYVVTMTIFGNVKHLLYSKAKITAMVKVRAAQSILLVIGMLLVLPRYELAGAASVVSFLYLAGTILALIYVRRFIDIAFRKMIVPPLLAGGIVMLLLELFKRSVVRGEWFGENVSMLLQAILAFLIYSSVLWLIERKRLRRDVDYMLHIIGVKA